MNATMAQSRSIAVDGHVRAGPKLDVGFNPRTALVFFKSHLTYAQGASAELVAAVTIAAADIYGLPVSTTHVLSSGVAGTMAASRSGLQMSTVRNLLMAWVLTLPVAILLSGGLFLLFTRMF